MPQVATPTRKAIGIARQSHGDGESVAQQIARLEDACRRDGLDLIAVHEEQDVSGRTPLAKRPGLRQAIEGVEAGEADVIIAAYFDRLIRSLKVQAELVERVEAVEGQVLAVDVGRVTNGSAGQWLSGTMLGAVAEYHARTSAERTAEAQARAVKRGVWMSPNIPPGYLRGEDGILTPSPDADTVADAFDLRARGATVGEVRAQLAAHGIEMSYPAVTRLLKSRAVLGEVRFGDLVNREAHPAIVDAEVWKAAQRAKPPRGRRAKSERLLARLGVLRCGSCGRRMSASTGHNGTRPLYRCGSHVGDDCPHPITISAEKVEGIVTDAVRARLADVEGRASAEQGAREAAQALERAQAELDALIGLLDPLEPAAAKRLAEATAKRDAAQERLEQLGGQRASVTLNAAADWDRLSLDAKRALIRATVDRVEVDPGRGPGRVTVHLVGQ
jgi:site-specific DNA recombinase